MKMPMLISNNIAGFIEKLDALPVTKLYMLDAILSDLANHICEIDESVEELKKQLGTFDKQQKEDALTGIRHLEKQLTDLSELLYKTGYESHYMDRTLSILNSTLDGIEEIE